ncbi:MAG: DUF4258 domain-containing protein [Ardenticatenaceae bacterium]|nr:DUF4258 domain-containing protein [Ardenticatenaceae bacterium]MCB9445685.1 DUF4258 domain-containing protein [Ardenticatenaceae bacterium]
MNHREITPYYIPHWSNFQFTGHAEQRMAQRNLSWEDVQIVLMCGQRFHKAGAIFIYLRSRDIPDELQSDNRFSRLEGTTIVVSRDEPGLILTVYRNRQKGVGHIRRKKNSRRAPHFYH